MKCPRCKYVSFDYVDTCPKCGKNLSSEKAKLNNLSVKPNPPSMLGSLTGDLNDGVDAPRMPNSMNEDDEGLALEEEEIYDDGSELDIDIDGDLMASASGSVDLGLGDPESSGDFEASERGLVSSKDSAMTPNGAGKEDQALNAQDPGKDSKKTDFELDDLELKLDFDEDENSAK